MKTAIFATPPWLKREATVIRRLVIGLIGEMIQVSQIMPYSFEMSGDGDKGGITGNVLRYEYTTFSLLRDYRLRRMIPEFQALDADVLHAMDVRMYASVVKLARELKLPMVCSLWSDLDMDRIKLAPDVPQIFCVPTKPLGDILIKELGSATKVTVTRPGIYTSSEDIDPPLRNPKEMMCILVVGDGKRDEYYQAMFEGFARIEQKMPQVMFFLHAARGDPHQLWSLASKLGLLSHITMIPSDTDIRSLLVQADIIIQPQPNRVVRTLLLEGMAAERPVIAAECPALDYLVDNESAMILAGSDAEYWEHLFKDIVNNPAPYIALGKLAKNYVKEHHSASKYIDTVIDSYKQVVTPEPIPFQSSSR